MISVAQQFNIAVGVLAIIPTWKLWSQYLRTKNLDFLIFGGVFATATLGLFFSLFASQNDILILYQIQYIFLNSTFFLLFWYSYRVVSNPKKSLLVIGVTWFILIIISILLWQKFEQPENTNFIFQNIPHSYSAYYPKGAGLKYHDSIIYSTGFRLFGDLFRIYAFIANLYVYITVKPVVPKVRLKQAKRLWIVAASFLLFYAALILPWMHIIPIVPNLLNFLGLVIIAYIAIRIPEGLIISHAQMLRISYLYEIASKYDGQTGPEQYDSLISYMRGIEKEQ